MNSHLNTLNSELASLFFEYIENLNEDWSSAYFRCVYYDAAHTSFQWNFKIGNKLKLAEMADEIFEKYSDAITELTKGVLTSIHCSNIPDATVVVLTINKDRTFKFNYSYGDCKAIDISILSIGKPNSFFINDKNIT